MPWISSKLNCKSPIWTPSSNMIQIHLRGHNPCQAMSTPQARKGLGFRLSTVDPTTPSLKGLSVPNPALNVQEGFQCLSMPDSDLGFRLSMPEPATPSPGGLGRGPLDLLFHKHGVGVWIGPTLIWPPFQ